MTVEEQPELALLDALQGNALHLASFTTIALWKTIKSTLPSSGSTSRVVKLDVLDSLVAELKHAIETRPFSFSSPADWNTLGKPIAAKYDQLCKKHYFGFLRLSGGCF